MRIVKEPEERRNEILDAAQTLFISKGYAKTTVMDILGAVGIAKGTFYYYFKSKEEVMDGIVQRIVEGDAAAARKIIADGSLTPHEKLTAILVGQKPKGGEAKAAMLTEFHQIENAMLHQKSIAASIRVLAPLLGQVMEEGIRRGEFRTPYPVETVEILLAAASTLFDEGIFHWEPAEMLRRVQAFTHVMERALGAAEGSFAYMLEVILSGS